jgi:hypothetical protein
VVRTRQCHNQTGLLPCWCSACSRPVSDEDQGRSIGLPRSPRPRQTPSDTETQLPYCEYCITCSVPVHNLHGFGLWRTSARATTYYFEMQSTCMLGKWRMDRIGWRKMACAWSMQQLRHSSMDAQSGPYGAQPLSCTVYSIRVHQDWWLGFCEKDPNFYQIHIRKFFLFIKFFINSSVDPLLSSKVFPNLNMNI